MTCDVTKIKAGVHVDESCVEVYKATKKIVVQDELYELASQLRYAVVPVTANIDLALLICSSATWIAPSVAG